MTNDHLTYRLIDIPRVDDDRGSLSYIEGADTVPFEIRRVYYLYEFSGSTRGEHAHRELEQALVVPAGQLTVRLDDGRRSEEIILDDPAQGLYVPPGIWRELEPYGPETVCFVLASEHYDEDDYIRDYQAFLEWNDLE